jgi:hypothetical protein
MATQLKKTVIASGASYTAGDYTSLEACMNANEQDLVSADKYFDVEVDGLWISADTTNVTVHNYTTDATRYINIYTTAGSRHKGKWSDLYYRLQGGGFNSNALLSDAKYIRVSGLQFTSTDGGGSGDVVQFYPSSPGTDVRLSYCIITNESSADHSKMLHIFETVEVWNCIIYPKGNGVVGISSDSSAGINLYNCTVINTGISSNQSYNATNCLVVRTSGACFGAGISATLNYCASSDGTADDFSGSNNKVSISTTNLFVDATNRDYHLQSGTTSDVKDAGTNSVGGYFTDDIDGSTRTGTWDIGADEYASQLLHTVKPSGGDFTSLNACIDHLQSTHSNLKTSNQYADIEIDGSWSSDDTTAVDISAITSGHHNYINIYTKAGDSRHDGKRYGSKSTAYRLVVASSFGVFPINFNGAGPQHIRIDGLQIKPTGSSGSYNIGITHNFPNASLDSDVRISNNILIGTGLTGTATGGGIIPGYGGNYASCVWIVFNNLVYGFNPGSSDVYGIMMPNNYGQIYGLSIGYNNTCYGNYYGMRFFSTYCPLSFGKNNLCNGNTYDYWESGDMPTYHNNNLSEDTTSYDNAYDSQAVHFVSETADSEDFHLASDDTHALDNGADLSTDTYFAFTTDIDGQTRSGTWDIGADEYFPLGSTSPSVSASVSPSASPSPSVSPSVSPSASPSPSVSPSISPSASPSSSPSPGWENYSRGSYASLPSGITDLTTAYSAGDYTDVNTDNGVRVGIISASDYYAIHQFKDYVGAAGTFTVTWDGQTDLAPNKSPVVLQIYNHTSGLWETIDSDSATAADTDFTLTWTITVADYKDADGVITCRVYQKSETA